MRRVLAVTLLCCSSVVLGSGPATAPTADEQAMAAFWARMESSADPRMQALAMVAPFEALGGPADLPARIDRWEASEPDADALVLLAALACGHDSASRLRAMCDRRELLARWKQADPANAYPWLIEAHRAQQSEDAERLQQALSGIGQSSRIEDGYRLALATLRDALAADSSFAAMDPGGRAVAAFGIATAIAIPAVRGITDLCPPVEKDAAMRAERGEICRHLGSLLFDTPQTSLLHAQLGGQIARDYAEDDADRSRRNEDLAALQGLASALNADPLLSPADAGKDGVITMTPELDEYLQWVIAEGEVAAMLGWLKRRETAARTQRDPGI
jgi:hypothetical protein